MAERKLPRVPAHVKTALKEQAVRGQVKPPDMAKLVSHYFEVAGGERQVARQLYEEFVNSSPGGVVRQRILDLIMRMTRYCNDKTAPVDDLGQLSDEDLERELEGLMDQVAEGATDGHSEQRPGPAQEKEGSGSAQRELPAAPGAPPGAGSGSEPGTPGDTRPPDPALRAADGLGPGGPRGNPDAQSSG